MQIESRRSFSRFCANECRYEACAIWLTMNSPSPKLACSASPRRRRARRGSNIRSAYGGGSSRRHCRLQLCAVIPFAEIDADLATACAVFLRVHHQVRQRFADVPGIEHAAQRFRGLEIDACFRHRRLQQLDLCGTHARGRRPPYRPRSPFPFAHGCTPATCPAIRACATPLRMRRCAAAVIGASTAMCAINWDVITMVLRGVRKSWPSTPRNILRHRSTSTA